MKSLCTWLPSTHIVASTISCVWPSVCRHPRMSFRCDWTRQQTVYPAVSPYMMIYVYLAIPLRSMTGTSCAWWRLAQNMAPSSTAPSVRSGSLRLPSMVQYLLPKACGQTPPKSKPSKTSPHLIPSKASVLPRPDQLPTALYTQSVSKNKVPTWTACWGGLEPFNRCSFPAPQGLDLSDPPQCYHGIL